MFRVLIFPTIILVLLGGLCILAASGGVSQRGQITYASSSDVHTLDPQQMTWAQDIRVAMGLWEGLLAYDPVTLKPIAGYADMPQISADGLTYTFKLHPGLKWSNGDPLTAKDFYDSWQRALDPGTGNEYIAMYYHIAGAEAYSKSLVPPATPLPFSSVGIAAPDPLTIRITLAEPCTYFNDLMAFSPFYPLNLDAMKKAEAAGKQWTHPPYLVTNGPYMLKDWQFKSFLLLEPNPYYYDRDKVRCPRLKIVSYYQQDNAALLAYQSGAVDVMSWIPPEYTGPELVAEANAGKRHDVFFKPVFGTYYYLFNCKHPPFDDPRVRQAFALAIDKQQIVEQITRMGQKPLDVIVPPGAIPGYISPAGLHMDVARAQALLAAAGYPGGHGFPATELLYTSGGTHESVAQAVGQMWTHQLGVPITFRGLETKAFHNMVAGDHQFAIARGGWYGDYPDPTTWLDLARSNNGDNNGQFSNAQYDALMAQSDKEADPAKRFAILAQAEKFLLEDQCAFIPLYQYSDGCMFDPAKIGGCDANVRMMTLFKYIHRLP